jgi:hypothetical protein
MPAEQRKIGDPFPANRKIVTLREGINLILRQCRKCGVHYLTVDEQGSESDLCPYHECCAYDYIAFMQGNSFNEFEKL